MRAAARSVITCGDVITHLRRASSELLVPTPVLSGTHCRQRLARLINWFNDAIISEGLLLTAALCNQEF